jgi:hypothetical protein
VRWSDIFGITVRYFALITRSQCHLMCFFLRSYHCVSVTVYFVDSHHNVFGVGCNVAPISISHGDNLCSNTDNLPLLREL